MSTAESDAEGDRRGVLEAYRSGSRLWNFPRVLPPLRVLNLHVGPLENFLYIRESILADSGGFDILPGKTNQPPQRHIQRSSWGLMIHREVIICHPDRISNASQIINFQSRENNAPLWLRVWVL